MDIPSRAAAALIAGTATDGSFSLTPGKNLTIVCAVSSDFKSEDCLRTVIREAKDVGSRRLREIRKNHEKWWRDYWNKSYVSIPDPVIEKQYYLSLYGMASCSRDPEAPLLAAIPRGEWYSEKVTGIPGGIMLPVGIGPLGIETTRWSESLERNHKDWLESGNIQEGGMFWGQKSNSAYAVVNMAMRFYRTWDREYALKVYPFVRGVATFWENYLTPEGDRYIILNDAIHPCLTL